MKRYITEEFAADMASRYAQAPAPSPSEHAFTLLFVQTLFHSGKLSTRSKGLLQLQDAGCLSINPVDAGNLGLTEGDQVRMWNARGSVTTTVKIRQRVPTGLVWFPEHFDGEAKHLADWTIDPQGQIPYFKRARVSLAKVP